MHELPLLINIAVALVAAFIGGMVARFLKLPQIVGYMIAGIAIGPFTPGFSGDVATISQLAELGVVFLMFGVGLHFSIDDLWKVRSIAIPGAIGQMFVTTILGYLFATFLGWSQSASVVLGLAISIASTVVLLRGLMDNGLLNTQHGQAAVGWLILEDIATVLILLLMPTLASGEGGLDWGGLGLTLLKAGAFFISLIFIGRKLIPWMLMGSARSGSRELFLLAVLAVSVGIALAATEIFGVSIALGAFAAGVVVSESKLSHQVSADILPFRDAFSVLFFVSIGMMVNIHYLGMNVFALIALVLLVTIGKYLVTLLMGVLIKRPARTFLVVAAGLSQIGEFSFILGQAGMALGLLDQNQYSMILASALLSIAVNPLMYQTTMPVERFLRKRPRFWRLFDRHSGEFEMPESMSDHVVVIGFGRVGQHIVNVLVELGIPLIVVEADLDRVEKLMERNIPALYGDAGTSEVIFHAHLTTARLLVVTTPEEAVTDIIVSDARSVAPDLHIVARGASDVGVAQLYELGANYVIHPELEGGLQILRRTLLELGYSLRKVQQYTDAVRSDQYDSAINTKEERHFLTELLIASDNIGLSWLSLHDDSGLIGKTLIDAKLRELTGASVVAILRTGKLIGNPPARTVLKKGDVIGLIGSDDDIEKARAVFGHAI
ncbi:MAG: sodium:proton exchanger [Acidobacteria bacterium ACB1]|nr:putative cation/proton antiporter YbaL [Pyrinomonadaceae bacterium]MCE7963317.1 sodium:proton exchanger [Acidobacteria bacterium ACB1]RIJ92432.1 MAG: sodium:proton exchanger [Acidobacteriota bacterium]